ncbi:MAG: PspC domain-containing protein [Firmicutes bacterium]|nr:PspC domain-containing protein [Bacillota bacterium]
MAKRIYRSPNKKIAGVCGGIAEYFNIDPTIIRLIWAIAILIYGTGLLAYLICWLVIPDDPFRR